MTPELRPTLFIGLICLFFGAVVGFGYQYLAVSQYKSNRLAEKETVLAVVDAFFSTYSSIRGESDNSALPVPATFRAHTLETFNANRKSEDNLSLSMVGFPGREIRTLATDTDMRDVMFRFANEGSSEAVVSLLEVAGVPVLRTVRPSIANRESCVSCHNRYVSNGKQWQLGIVMGAFVVDAPAGNALDQIRFQSVGLGFLAFFLTFGLGLFAYYHHSRQSLVTAQARVFRRLGQAIEAMDNGFAVRGRDRELVLSNEAHKWWRDNGLGAVPGEALTNVAADGETVTGGETRKEVNILGRWFEIYEAETNAGDSVEIIMDITERKHAELALVASQKMAEDANRAKSEFLATMSHEIRTPMNGIVGMAGVLADTDLSPSQKEYVQTISESSAALMDILNDILDLSKIEAGRLTVDRTDVFVGELITQARALWENPATAKGLAFSVSSNVPGGLRVVTDRTKILQILNNLLGNAIKFTASGKIELKVELVQETADRVELRFEVHDTGIGITDEQAGVLFQPFTQADSSTTRDYGGTGLGLSISRSLVEVLGGDIGITSEFGSGSMFWFTIIAEPGAPLSDRTNPENETHAPARMITGKRAPRILLAEDNFINQKVITAVLNTFGAHIDLVENGVAAVTALVRSDYDLVLMDIQMPKMDGIAATTRIRELGGEKASVPIIALTGNAMQGDRESYLKAGMTGYVSKPINIPEFRTLISEYLSRSISDDEYDTSEKPHAARNVVAE